MTIDFNFLLMCINTAFLFIWGAYERISAIRKGKQHAETADRDRGSLVILYGTIFLGYGVGIPLAFLGYGKVDTGFPWVSISGFCVILLGLAIRLTAIRTLARQFTYTVRIIENHELSPREYTGTSAIPRTWGSRWSSWEADWRMPTGFRWRFCSCRYSLPAFTGSPWRRRCCRNISDCSILNTQVKPGG